MEEGQRCLAGGVLVVQGASPSGPGIDMSFNPLALLQERQCAPVYSALDSGNPSVSSPLLLLPICVLLDNKNLPNCALLEIRRHCDNAIAFLPSSPILRWLLRCGLWHSTDSVDAPMRQSSRTQSSASRPRTKRCSMVAPRFFRFSR